MNIKRLAENLLIAANVFILFILIFYPGLHLPAWVQVTGRLHPLLLHFPIVLLLLALVLDGMMLRNQYLRNYQPLISNLWLAGALTAAITAISGLFLSVEDVYSGSMLSWHKWTGLGIVWLSSLLYMVRYYKRPVFIGGSVLMLAGLAMAGHFGANLTHGSDFLLAPVTPPPQKIQIPLDQALVYEHLVKPIFEQKCVSCHNPAKAKGQLLMETPAQLLKGGKTGLLFVAGNPAASLMLQRIHLPLEEKKHMPPKNKTQLEPEEIAILQLWIRGGADFKQKVSDLPAGDSLYLLAAQRLQPDDAGDRYDFAAADEKTIQKLNNNYRVIYPIARHSPALVVNFYNQTQYSAKSLEELLPLKKQIIELHLQKMPVQDAELAIIKQFENLRRLNLDFTAITGKTLAGLNALPRLRSLAVSGTRVTAQHLKPLAASKSLKEVYCWNTDIAAGDWQQLAAIKNIRFEKGYVDDGSDSLRLNPPVVENEQTIFASQMTLKMRHPIRGTEIRYTLDGSEVDSLKSPIFKDSLRIDSSFTIRAKAYKPGWYGSDAVKMRFMKTTYRPDSAVLLQPANEKYVGDGPKTFSDHQTGNFDISSGKWLGFRYNDMELLMTFRQPVKMKHVTLNTMRLTRSYIFPPASIEVWGGTDPGKLQLLKKISPAQPGKKDNDSLMNITCTFPEQQLSCLRIVAVPVAKLPQWHDGKGQKAWFFIDEILLN
ncbi:cytochrome C [Chitinophaga lutea]|uniref:Cytochrome C n=1 Tax=Chitinophaga lutea TaxID=2488634 RepID=A0A3N4PCX3_9BACT|nr:c-type cytochrome domain-containing protein [Chitinophaga lutea]RPE05915.1 cytochrome C [Chitinophaga lutea]